MLALATLRSRWTSFVGTFVALALGVALITTALLVLVGTQPRVPRTYDAAPVLVQSTLPDGRPWSSETADQLAQRLGAIPDVVAAVPDRSFYAQVVLDGRPVGGAVEDRAGHAWSVATLAGDGLVAGRGPERDGEVALDAGLGQRPGERVTVLMAHGADSYTVTGTVAGPGIYLADAAAARYAGGVRVIGLVTAPTADLGAVSAAAASIVEESGRVLVGSTRTEAESARDRRLRGDAGSILSTLASLSVFVAIFVVASTFAFAVAQRRREVGLLRAVGATPRQIRRMLFAEAFLIGVLASAVGIGLGVLLTVPFTALLVRAQLFPPGLSLVVPAWVLAVAGGTGIVVALAGVWSVARRAAKVRPLEALREAAVELGLRLTVGRWIAGIGAFGLGVFMVWTASTSDADSAVITSLFSAMALIVGLTMLAPLIIGPLVWLVTRPLGGTTALLVREGARVAVRRVASTAAPVIATVGFSALMAGSYATLHAFDVTEESRALPTGVVVVPDGVPGLSDAVPGASESTLETVVYAAGHEPLEATSGDQPADTIAVAESEAANLAWSAGTEAVIGFADGRTETLRVGAVLADELVPGDVVVARSVVRAHDPSALSDLVPVDAARADAATLGVLGARAVPAADYVNARSAADWAIVRLVYTLLIGMAVGYTAIAIANTLLMATVDRRRDFATLRLSGATVGQVLRVVAAEAVLVVGIGSLLGLVAAVIALAGIVSGLRYYIPETSMVLPVPAVAAVVGACLVLALGASLLPARLALRAPATSLAPAAD